MRDLTAIDINELALLLALKREGEISAAQLLRLDFLLQLRGQQIDALIAAASFPDKCAA